MDTWHDTFFLYENYPRVQSPQPIIHAIILGNELVMVITSVWQHGHLTLQACGPSWLIATTWTVGVTIMKVEQNWYNDTLFYS